MNTITTLGQHIRQLREKKDFSLREFAGKLRVSAAFLSDIELGRRHPSDKVLSEIARLLDTSVGELREYDTRPPVEEIRKRSNADPAYGLAFRKLVDENLDSEQLLRMVAQAKRTYAKKK